MSDACDTCPVCGAKVSKKSRPSSDGRHVVWYRCGADAQCMSTGARYCEFEAWMEWVGMVRRFKENKMSEKKRKRYAVATCWKTASSNGPTSASARVLIADTRNEAIEKAKLLVWSDAEVVSQDATEILDDKPDQPAAPSRRQWLVVVSGTGGMMDSFLKVPAESEAEAVGLGTAWARENVSGWYYRVTAYDASDVEELTVLG